MTEAREPLRERMRGRWHGVLPHLGVPSGFLNGKHQPCPMCGGKDRARYDDRDGVGTYFCSQCGAGDGIALVMKINGWDFKTAAERIEAVAGDVQPRSIKAGTDPKSQLSAMRRAWGRARPIADAVSKYLSSRGLNAAGLHDLRQSSLHEMVALVRDMNGGGCQVHRTLLTEDGRKADVPQVRLFMPGPIPKGAAVRLMQYDDALGIAEGIETALSAAMLFQVPVWAALNASMLKAWEAPSDVKRVTVFGDNDENYTGQAAAYELARRLCASVEVAVQIPERSGFDWNDVLRSKH